MAEEYDEQTAFQDFLEMDTTRFKLKYGDKEQVLYDGKNPTSLRVKQIIRNFKQNPPVLDRKSPGKSHKRNYRQRNPDAQEKMVKEIRELFNTKGMSADGINVYLNKLRDVGAKGKDVVPEHFLYNGRPLTLRRLKMQNIDGENLSHKSNVTQELLIATVEDLERLIPGNQNLAALRYYAETTEDKQTPTEKPEEVEYLPDLAIGSFDLELVSRREEIYEYWGKRYLKMKEVLDISKEIVDEYDKNNKYYEMLDDDMGSEQTDKSFRNTLKILNGKGSEGDGEDWTHPNNYIMAIEATRVKVGELNRGRIHEVVRIWFDEITRVKHGITGGADWGRDSDDTAQVSGWQEGQTLEEADQITATGEVTETLNELEQSVKDAAKEEGRWERLLSDDIWVDPLLFYLIENNKIELGAFTRIEMKDAERHLQRRVRRMKAWVREYRDDESVVDGLGEYIKKIKDRASNAKAGEFYHVPLSPEMVHLEFKTKIDDSIIKKHQDFLKAIHRMLIDPNESTKFRAPQYQTGPRIKERSSAIPSETFPEPYGVTGMEGTIAQLREMDEQTKMPKLFKKLIKAIEDYYLDPSRSQFYPFEKGKSGDMFADMEISDLRNTLEANWKTKGKKGAWKGTAVMARAWADAGTDMITYSELTNITLYLKAQKRYDGNNFPLLYDKAIDAYYALESVTDKQLTNLNKIWFAYHLDLLARKNGNNIKGRKFMGEFILELKDQYKKELDDYPMKEIQTILESKSGFRSKGPHDRPIDKKKIRAVNDFLKWTKVTKSDVEIDILLAHDTIRKMLGKPIYYALGSIDDFDDVNNTIDVIKKANNVELMPVEIENIVNEFDSHQSLSKKYGLSEEVIYRVKAMYR